MAAPVLALSFFPQALKRLPKPGPWMETFKQVMAFPLFATVVWLAWVLGAQAGNDAVISLLAGLLALGIGAWIYGRWARSEGFARFAFAAAFAAAGLWLAWPGAEAAPEKPGAAPAAKAGEIAWQAWSPERLAELRAAGTPVFVDFTAAWCVTCQVNKRLVLNDASVRDAFADRGVELVRADWTRRDPVIGQALNALGRQGVPVYVLYRPGKEPLLLPEVLRKQTVLDALATIDGAAPKAASFDDRTR
jgi:thiol:disulfide interchange protein DsbD